MIWCPYCHRAANVKRFYANQCPQCGKIVGNGEELHENPYQPEEGSRWRRTDKPRKFKFDQKDGSIMEESSGALKSKLVDPTFGIEGRI